MADEGRDIGDPAPDPDVAADRPGSGPPRWIWWVAGFVLLVFVVAISLAGSSDDTTSTPTTTSADSVPPALSAALGRVVLPSIAGYRIVPPTSGSEVLSRSEIEGRSARARVVPVPGARAEVGRRRDFESTSSDDVVRVVLLRMQTVADAARARADLQQWWVQQQGTVLADQVPIGSTTALVGASRAADANGDHVQITVGVAERTVFVVLRFSKTAAPDTAALLKVATDQALRLQAG